MVIRVAIALFLTHLIQEERGIFRVFERIRVDLPNWLEDNGYDHLHKEVLALTQCPYCLTAYTAMLVMIMPKVVRDWLMIWLIGYVGVWIYEQSKGE